MKKLSKRQLQKKMERLLYFFDYKHYKIIHGKLIRIKLKSEVKGDSGLYNFKDKRYLDLERKLKELFSLMLKKFLKKQLLIKTSYSNSWFTPGKMEKLQRCKAYKQFVNFINKNKIQYYFEGAIIIEKKDIKPKLLQQFIEMNIRDYSDFDFIFDENLIVTINHHMEYFLFLKDNQIVNDFIKREVDKKLFMITEDLSYFN